jgi:hypothetical protein
MAVVEATSTPTPVSPSSTQPAAAASTGSDGRPALTAADDG